MGTFDTPCRSASTAGMNSSVVLQRRCKKLFVKALGSFQTSFHSACSSQTLFPKQTLTLTHSSAQTAQRTLSGFTQSAHWFSARPPKHELPSRHRYKRSELRVAFFHQPGLGCIFEKKRNREDVMSVGNRPSQSPSPLNTSRHRLGMLHVLGTVRTSH